MARRLLFRLLSAASPAGDHVADAALLRRYASGHDAAAFELLVRRHADAVWAACRRILPEHDAEDAFQATFLVLARKAASVRGECVGGWLHRVAVNAALKLRTGSRRHPASELPVEPTADVIPVEAAAEQAELAATVHEELARLPERYRLPVVLCDLEGQTHADAARVLGWPVGSVSGRLSRARTILRDRLTRRGLVAPAVLFGTLTAPIPVLTAAVGVGADAALAASTAVSTLAEGVLVAMRTAKLKLTAAVLVATGFALASGAGTVYVLARTPDGTPAGEATAAGQEPPAKADPPAAEDWTPNRVPPLGNLVPGRMPAVVQVGNKPVPTAFPDLKVPEPEKGVGFSALLVKACPRNLGETPPEVVPADDPYRRLLKARLHQGRLYLQRIWQIIDIGRWDSTYFSQLIETLDDMRAVAIELWGSDSKTLIPWLEEFVVVGKAVERFIETRVRVGSDPPQNLNVAAAHRLRAEAALWKAKAGRG